MWLITKSRLEEARKSIAWLRGWVHVSEVEDEFQELYKQINSSNNNEKQLSCFDKLKLFKNKTFLWPYVLVALAFFLSHFNGATTLGIYAIKIFEVFKVPMDKYFATVLMGCVQLMGCIVCMIFINRFGKRSMNFVSLLGTAICFIVVAAYAYMNDIFYFKEPNVRRFTSFNTTSNSTSLDVVIEGYSWIPVCFLVLGTFLTYIGIRILPWILTGEVYPTEIRATASGISGGTGYIFNFLTNKIFLSLVSFWTLPGLFLFYGLLGILGTVAIYFLLPETEGKSLFDVTEHFAGRSKLRNSVGRKKKCQGQSNPAFVDDTKL